MTPDRKDRLAPIAWLIAALGIVASFVVFDWNAILTVVAVNYTQFTASLPW